MKLNTSDLALLEKKGKSPERLEEELTMLAEGFPYLRIEAPATVGNGIVVPEAAMKETSLNIWTEFLNAGGKVMKMTPASGAASRMFKDLFAFANGKHSKPDNDFLKTFFENIEVFPFFRQLNRTTLRLYGKSVASMVKAGDYRDVVKALIMPEGMNYGALPKALLAFHLIPGDARTPIEEHIAEAAQYAVGKDGKARVHFTVSEEHIPAVKQKIEEVEAIISRLYCATADISLSIQKPATDTVAANLDGTPYREDGELFFRPGGHGALIENLNDLDADVVFIKNIDNVVPASKRESTIEWKRILGGILVGIKQRIDEYMRKLDKDDALTDELIEEMLAFIRTVLCVTHDIADTLDRDGKKAYIREKLNRPLRVCGMVKNEGEPGGGPFLTFSPDGTVQLQILESAQINPKDKEAMKMLKQSTHFNPVDLVCALRDYKGRKFDLRNYVDKSTGFISQKSREGVEIKALELPGLWNGAMSDWSTIMVEVPADTFNPVKTVNDLLRPSHRIDL